MMPPTGTRRFPHCRKAGVLRIDNSGRLIVATATLRDVLGEEAYQECCQGFVYVGNFPQPDSVEEFLRKESK